MNEPSSSRGFQTALRLTPARTGPAYWFLFSDDRLLVRMQDATATVPFSENGPPRGLNPVRQHVLGILDQIPCHAAELLPDTPLPEGYSLLGLRRLFGVLAEHLFSVAFRGKQIVAWDQTHQYCGRCATPTRQAENERSKVCPACGLVSFPRIAPAVIVAVTRGDELLLARAQRFPVGFYSVLAGFVEIGETLEECVHREIREEVGIKVTNLRYFGSQSWPFPHSLMVAFTAEYAGGRIKADPDEIADAQWFRADALPQIPEKISIARSLIDWFAARSA